MTLQYTTTEAIARRLRGRLLISDDQPLVLGGQMVDPDLVAQIGEQVEAWVDGALKRRYVTPLATTAHPQLASMVEKGVVCQLLGVHYVTPEMSEIAGYGQMMCSQYKSEILALSSGEIELDGETLLTAVGPTNVNFAKAAQQRPRYTDHRSAENLKW